MRNLILYMSFLFLLISLLSCSHEDDFLEDYLVVYEHTINDTISNKDSTQKYDTLIVVTDTISHKDSVNNSDSLKTVADTINTDTCSQSPTAIKKDTLVVSYEKYMDITTSFGNEQGGACYDKYFFQGYAKNESFGVFDLEKKTFICKIDIHEPAAGAYIHVNTINFGSSRMYEDDFFPLLYVCSGYTKNIKGSPCSFIYVYRIQKHSNADNTEIFTIELVQTITLKGFGSWTDGILDNEHNVLWIKYGYRLASFPLPRPEDGDITIQCENALSDFTFGTYPFKSSNQGHLYHDNKIMIVSGISANTQKLAFIVINLLTQNIELVIDLAEIGLTSEPENVFFYKDQLMIGYRTAIYKFNVRPIN